MAAGDDRGQDLFRFGCGEDELHMRRRFFQRLQQCVECRGTEHVDFVNDVDLEASAGGNKFHRFAQLADLVDAVVGCTVDFHHIQAVAGHDLFAGRTFIAGGGGLADFAIQCLGKNAGNGCFANTPGTDEQVRMSQTAAFQGIFQGFRDVCLADHIVKLLWTPFTRQYLIFHAASGPLLSPLKPHPLSSLLDTFLLCLNSGTCSHL